MVRKVELNLRRQSRTVGWDMNWATVIPTAKLWPVPSFGTPRGEWATWFAPPRCVLGPFCRNIDDLMLVEPVGNVGSVDAGGSSVHY